LGGKSAPGTAASDPKAKLLNSIEGGSSRPMRRIALNRRKARPCAGHLQAPVDT
jgi:hypothetical protein